MKPVEDTDSKLAGADSARRIWTAPAARRLATSEAENSSSIGSDAETVAS